MSPETKQILAKFGWYEGRQLPETILTEWTETLERFGLRPFDAAINVLAEFGGLRIQPHRQPGSTHRVADINLNPLLGGFGEEDRVEGWIAYLKQPVYPIGEADGLLLLVAEDDRIVWDGQGIDSSGAGFIIADTIHGAIDALLQGDKPLIKTAPFW